MSKITWTARNNNSYLNGERQAKSIRSAVIAARRYVRNELYGEGAITFFENGEPIRFDERSIYTGYRWTTKPI